MTRPTAPDVRRAQIEQRVLDYMAACTRGDADAISQHLGENAVHYFPPDMYDGPWRGSRYIAERWAKAVREGESAWTVDSLIVDESRRTAACEWTHFKMRAASSCVDASATWSAITV